MKIYEFWWVKNAREQLFRQHPESSFKVLRDKFFLIKKTYRPFFFTTVNEKVKKKILLK